jgi:hypothetical protein
LMESRQFRDCLITCFRDSLCGKRYAWIFEDWFSCVVGVLVVSVDWHEKRARFRGSKTTKS